MLAPVGLMLQATELKTGTIAATTTEGVWPGPAGARAISQLYVPHTFAAGSAVPVFAAAVGNPLE